jgi:hypothetical protein
MCEIVKEQEEISKDLTNHSGKIGRPFKIRSNFCAPTFEVIERGGNGLVGLVEAIPIFYHLKSGAVKIGRIVDIRQLLSIFV